MSTIKLKINTKSHKYPMIIGSGITSKLLKLLNRIKKSKKRPIAFSLNDNELIELIAKRSKIYSKAKIKINCHKLTKTEIVQKILQIYEHN